MATVSPLKLSLLIAMIRILGKLVRQCLRCLLILLMICTLCGLIQSLVTLSANLNYSRSLSVVGIGFCVGLLVFSMLSTFPRTYVFGHELTHWLLAKIFGRRTSGLRIGKNMGSVAIERPNFLIVLGPYFLPLYTLVWVIIGKVLQVSITRHWVTLTLYSGIGFTYAYHVVMTALALSKNQSDLRLYGHFFSICIIVTVNFLIFFFGISYLSNALKTGCLLLGDSFHSQWRLFDSLLG